MPPSHARDVNTKIKASAKAALHLRTDSVMLGRIAAAHWSPHG